MLDDTNTIYEYKPRIRVLWLPSGRNRIVAPLATSSRSSTNRYSVIIRTCLADAKRGVFPRMHLGWMGARLRSPRCQSHSIPLISGTVGVGVLFSTFLINGPVAIESPILIHHRTSSTSILWPRLAP